MKSNFPFRSGLRLAWVVALLPAGPRASGQQVISVEEARRSIRQFERIPDLRLTLKGLDWGRGRDYRYFPLWEWPLYCFYSEDPRLPKVGYAVDPFTGRVFLRRDDKVEAPLTSDDPTKTVDHMLAPKRLYEIGVQFIKKYEPGFDPHQYRVKWVAPRVANHERTDTRFLEYSPRASLNFLRWITLPDGRQATLPGAGVSIDMHSETGAVREYFGPALPVPSLPAELKVSEEEAKRTAQGYLNQPEITYAEPMRAVLSIRRNASYPDCYVLFWSVTLAYLKQGQYYGIGVGVEAMTGKILEVWWAPLGDDFSEPQPSPQQIEEFRQIPQPDPPVFVKVGNEIVTSSTPPLLRDGRFYVRPSFAWLLAVRIVERPDGFQLRGVRPSQVPLSEILPVETERWLPLSSLAEASEAQVSWQEENRVLIIQPRYPDADELEKMFLESP